MRAWKTDRDILYLLQDMREFELVWNRPGSSQCLRFRELLMTEPEDLETGIFPGQ